MICSVVLPRKFKDVERDEKKIVTGSLVDLSGTKKHLIHYICTEYSGPFSCDLGWPNSTIQVVLNICC